MPAKKKQSSEVTVREIRRRARRRFSAEDSESFFVPETIDFTDLTPRELAPGDSFAAAFPVFYGAGGWTIRRPGSYQVSGILVDPASGRRLVESTPIDLLVVPDPAGEYLMEKSKGGHEAGLFLLWQSGDHLRAGIAHLEELVDGYQGSLLVSYAQLAFAHNLSRPFRYYSIGKLREPRPEAALRHLEGADPARLPPYLQVDHAMTEYLIRTALGDKEQAQLALERARSLVDLRPALEPLLEASRRSDSN